MVNMCWWYRRVRYRVVDSVMLYLVIGELLSVALAARDPQAPLDWRARGQSGGWVGSLLLAVFMGICMGTYTLPVMDHHPPSATSVDNQPSVMVHETPPGSSVAQKHAKLCMDPNSLVRK
jgi:hypothetical protein